MVRVGFGYDSHRFSPEPPPADGAPVQKLGGVAIRGFPRLEGHSDADALIHAVIDALFGAAALGDIGSHFPDDDPRWSDANSAVLLCMAAKEVADAGYAVGNIDVTVICERPKLRPHVDEIRLRLAGLLDIPVECVSVKGKTNEGMDAVGEGAGVAVHAVALLVPAEG